MHNDCEYNEFQMENLSKGQDMHASENFEVDIMDCPDSPSAVHLQHCTEDATEYSSSFGETDSSTESHVSDGEVESMYAGGGMLGSFNNGYGDVFSLRKKNLTNHWRLFIQPLRWYCKWLELQMKELNFQAIKYDNTHSNNEQRKQLGLESFHCGDVDSKSAPILTQTKGKKVMKRRKRKRKEDMVDLASYMSLHNVFSFYDKKPQSDVLPVKACSGNLGLAESLDFGSGTCPLEQLHAKIEMAHLHLCSVKERIKKLIDENAAKFASVKSLSMSLRDPLSEAFCDGASRPPDGSLQSSMSFMHVHSEKVSSSFQGNSIEPVIVGPDLKDPTASLAIKSQNQKSGGSVQEVTTDNPTRSTVAEEEPVSEDELMTISSEKFGEQPERHIVATASSASALGIISDKPIEGVLHLEDSNKFTASNAKTYVRKRRRRVRVTVQTCKRRQAQT